VLSKIFKVKNEIILEIYDSFVTLFDEELFYCRSNSFDGRWFRKETIPKEILEEFQQKCEQIRSTTACNTDKTTVYTCDIKVKTCGVLLACTCCGIIVNYKEFYGAESCTQVALFYLETIDNYKGILTGN